MSAAKTEWGLYNELWEAVPEVLNVVKIHSLRDWCIGS